MIRRWSLAETDDPAPGPLAAIRPVCPLKSRGSGPRGQAKYAAIVAAWVIRARRGWRPCFAGRGRGVRALLCHGDDRGRLDGADSGGQGAGGAVRRGARGGALRRPCRSRPRGGAGRAARRPGRQRAGRAGRRSRQLPAGSAARSRQEPGGADGGAAGLRSRGRHPGRGAERAGRPRRGRLPAAGDDLDALVLQPGRDDRRAGRRRLRLGGSEPGDVPRRRRGGGRPHRRLRRTLAAARVAVPRRRGRRRREECAA